jgi:hypothetical protein
LILFFEKADGLVYGKLASGPSLAPPMDGITYGIYYFIRENLVLFRNMLKGYQPPAEISILQGAT